MKTVLVLTLTLLLAAQQPSAQGTVTRAHTSDPIAEAQVVLNSEDPAVPDLMTQTDSRGSYAFSNISAGRYEIRVQSIGYFGRFAHGESPTFESRPCEITAAKPSCRVDLSLIPAGSISGRIFDPQGVPVPRAHVSALRMEYREGEPTIVAVDAIQANERGEYRLFRIGAGKYYIVAVEDPATGGRNGETTSYFPNSSGIDKAELVQVGESTEVRGIDVRLRVASTVRLRGTVLNEKGNPTMTSFFAIAQNPVMLFQGGSSLNTQWLDRNAGRFEIRGMEPGLYELGARGGTGAGERGYTGRMTIRIGGTDLDSVAMTIYPPVNVTIHISAEGKTPIDLKRVNFQLVSRSQTPPFRLNPARPADSPDVITFQNVPQSNAELRIFAPYPDAYTSDMRLNGRSIFNDGLIPVGSSPVSVDMIVNSEGGRIDGIVQGAPRDRIEDARVVLVPQGQRRRNSMLYQGTKPDSTGHFTFRGIAPGDYKVFAWESVLSGAWENAEFISAFENRGRSVSVKTGRPAVVKVQWIPDRGKP